MRIIYTSSKKTDLGKVFHRNAKHSNTSVLSKEVTAILYRACTIQNMLPVKNCNELHQEIHFLLFKFKILGTYSNYKIYKVREHNVLFLKQ